MAGTLTATTIQNDTSSPPTFRNNSVEIGTLCRAWVNFSGQGTPAIRGSFNVSSITDNGVGSYSVNFINNMPDEDYAFSAIAGNTGVRSTVRGGSTGPSESDFSIICLQSDVQADSPFVYAAVFR